MYISPLEKDVLREVFLLSGGCNKEVCISQLTEFSLLLVSGLVKQKLLLLIPPNHITLTPVALNWVEKRIGRI